MDVLVSIGLSFFALSYAAEGISGGEPVWKFVQGVMVGISIGAFGLSLAPAVTSKRGQAA